jgi:hypothetical protein
VGYRGSWRTHDWQRVEEERVAPRLLAQLAKSVGASRCAQTTRPTFLGYAPLEVPKFADGAAPEAEDPVVLHARARLDRQTFERDRVPVMAVDVSAWQAQRRRTHVARAAKWLFQRKRRMSSL